MSPSKLVISLKILIPVSDFGPGDEDDERQQTESLVSTVIAAISTVIAAISYHIMSCLVY